MLNFCFSGAFVGTIITTTISHLPLNCQFLRRGLLPGPIRRAANLWLGTGYPPLSQNLYYGSRSPFLIFEQDFKVILNISALYFK